MEGLSEHALQAHALAKVDFQGRRPLSSEVGFGLGDTLLPIRDCASGLWLVGRGQARGGDRKGQFGDIYPGVVVEVVLARTEAEQA